MAEKKVTKAKKTSTANTKKEMLQAYDGAIQELETQQATELRPDEQIQEKENKIAVDIADSLSTDKIIKDIGSIKSDVSRLLGELSDRLEQEVNTYVQVKKAIQSKEKELKDIYEIQRAAQSLAALLEVQHQQRQEFEEEMTSRKSALETEMASRKADLENEIQSMKEEWKEEKARHVQETEEAAQAKEKQRLREKEEYEYEFARQQQLTKNRFEDEKVKLEKELTEKRQQLETEFAAREKALRDQERELAELRERVQTYPKQLDGEIARATKEASEKIKLEAKNREDLLRKEFEGERNVLTTRIESLEKVIAEQNQRVARLTEQSEKALSQVQDIAVKAIEGSSNSKSFAQLQNLLSEQGRKTGSEK